MKQKINHHSIERGQARLYSSAQENARLRSRLRERIASRIRRYDNTSMKIQGLGFMGRF